MEIQNTAVKQFATWLQAKHPDIYAKAQPMVAGYQPTAQQQAKYRAAQAKYAAYKGLSGLGADTLPSINAPQSPTVTPDATTGWLNSLTNAIQQILPVAAATYSQKQLIDLNIARANAGLPPVDSSAVSPQVNVGVSSQVGSMANTLIYGALGLGALFVISSMMKKRSR